ncbi:unnamed protein product [Cuscuta campestris]|uniref:Uncharacterized protein n=1 Tax=Cuscuta campestris TaxID=132261 RepID=A0A484M0E4_9ASTE|nr:unnamed protein product [Cuscuta campestris]
MSSFSDRISSSEDRSSEDSNSSSSTGSSSPDSTPGQVPNSSIPDLHPVNQMPGEVFMGRDDPVDDEPGPYDLENETRDAWEERLHAADMEFEEFAIPDNQPAGDTGGSQANPAKTFPVHQETVEILDEDEPEDNRSKGKEKEKTGRRTKKVATNHPSAMNKRQRTDPCAAHQTVEEAYINLGLRLREVGEIGPITADRLGMDSPTEVARLKKKNEELALILKSQTDELAKLSKMVGSLGAENTRLKEENGQLLDEVSETKREMAEKEENFLGRAAAWVEENKAEAARVMMPSPEATMESFRLLYREPEGKKMITAIGSFGFKSGQIFGREASHRILLKRDPAFTAASYVIPQQDDALRKRTGHLMRRAYAFVDFHYDSFSLPIVIWKLDILIGNARDKNKSNCQCIARPYTVQGLLDELKTYEHELKKKKEEQVTPFPTALMTTSRIPSSEGTCTRNCDTPSSSQPSSSKMENYEEDFAMMVKQFRKFKKFFKKADSIRRPSKGKPQHDHEVLDLSDKDEEVNKGDRMKPTEFIPFRSLPLKTSQRNPDSDSAEPSGNFGQPSNIPDLSNDDNSGNGDLVQIHPETPTTSVLQPEAELNQPVNPNQHNLRWLRNHPPQQIIGDIQSGVRTRSAQQNLKAMLACFISQLSQKKLGEKLRLPNSGVEVGKFPVKNLDWNIIGISGQVPSGPAKKADLNNDYKLVLELVIACLECGSGVKGKKYEARYWLYYLSSKGENRASASATAEESSSDNVPLINFAKTTKRKHVVSPSPSDEAPQNLAPINLEEEEESSDQGELQRKKKRKIHSPSTSGNVNPDELKEKEPAEETSAQNRGPQQLEEEIPQVQSLPTSSPQPQIDDADNQFWQLYYGIPVNHNCEQILDDYWVWQRNPEDLHLEYLANTPVSDFEADDEDPAVFKSIFSKDTEDQVVFTSEAQGVLEAATEDFQTLPETSHVSEMVLTEVVEEKAASPSQEQNQETADEEEFQPLIQSQVLEIPSTPCEISNPTEIEIPEKSAEILEQSALPETVEQAVEAQRNSGEAAKETQMAELEVSETPVAIFEEENTAEERDSLSRDISNFALEAEGESERTLKVTDEEDVQEDAESLPMQLFQRTPSSHQVTNFHFHSSSIPALPDEIPEIWTKKVQWLIESALVSQHASFRQEIEQMEVRHTQLIEKSEGKHSADLKEISKSVQKTLEIISLLSETMSNTMEIYASDSQLQLKEINKVKEQIASVTVSLQKQMSLLQMDIRSALAVASANQVVTKDYLKPKECLLVFGIE